MPGMLVAPAEQVSRDRSLALSATDRALAFDASRGQVGRALVRGSVCRETAGCRVPRLLVCSEHADDA
jgi:hypothetical protein